MKICLWCEEEIKRPAKRLSVKEWDNIKLHYYCVMSYRHHGCAKKDVPVIPDRYCPACNEKLVRRENESLQAWKRRKCCNMKCASMGSVRIRRHPDEVALEEQQRVGVKQYKPGTPEFQQIAALYGG